jgi:hypothetical protein
VGPVDVVTESEIAWLRRELERLRAENIRLSRLLDLRGHRWQGRVGEAFVGCGLPLE